MLRDMVYGGRAATPICKNGFKEDKIEEYHHMQEDAVSKIQETHSEEIFENLTSESQEDQACSEIVLAPNLEKEVSRPKQTEQFVLDFVSGKTAPAPANGKIIGEEVSAKLSFKNFRTNHHAHNEKIAAAPEGVYHCQQSQNYSKKEGKKSVLVFDPGGLTATSFRNGVFEFFGNGSYHDRTVIEGGARVGVHMGVSLLEGAYQYLRFHTAIRPLSEIMVLIVVLYYFVGKLLHRYQISDAEISRERNRMGAERKLQKIKLGELKK